MRQLPGHDQPDYRDPARPGRVEAKIDGYPVEAVIVADPWAEAEAARVLRRLVRFISRVRWLDIHYDE